MAEFLKKLDFKKGEFVYSINNNQLQKNNTYKVLKLDYEEGGSFHDGYLQSAIAIELPTRYEHKRRD
jgi:hypothetical protein